MNSRSVQLLQLKLKFIIRLCAGKRIFVRSVDLEKFQMAAITSKISQVHLVMALFGI